MSRGWTGGLFRFAFGFLSGLVLGFCFAFCFCFAFGFFWFRFAFDFRKFFAKYFDFLASSGHGCKDFVMKLMRMLPFNLFGMKDFFIGLELFFQKFSFLTQFTYVLQIASFHTVAH